MLRNEDKPAAKRNLISNAWEAKQFGIAREFRSAELEQFPGIVESVFMEIIDNKLFNDDEAVIIFDLFRRTLCYLYPGSDPRRAKEMYRLLGSIPDTYFCGGPGPNYQVYFPKLKESILHILRYDNCDITDIVKFFLSINTRNGRHESKKFWKEIVRKTLAVAHLIEFDSLISLAGEQPNALLFEEVVNTLVIARAKYHGPFNQVYESRKRLKEKHAELTTFTEIDYYQI